MLVQRGLTSAGLDLATDGRTDGQTEGAAAPATVAIVMSRSVCLLDGLSLLLAGPGL